MMLDAVSRMALQQLRLMEQAFNLLRLDRHANSPANRGWMNLFRRWGRSPRLNAVFTTYSDLFTIEFVEFYGQYIAYYDHTIDAWPVPHPWDPVIEPRKPEPSAAHVSPVAPLTRARPPGPADWAAKPERSVVRGIYLDPGLREADPCRPSTTHAEPPVLDGTASPGPSPGGARDSTAETD